MNHRFLVLTLLLPILGACASAPERSSDQRQDEARLAACRRDAERAILFRDRGQTMRNDELDASSGVQSYLGIRNQTDRLGATFERNRMAAACARDTAPDAAAQGQATPAQPGAAPAAR
ncbi:hypothetical protein MVG78_13565 [Roseomonas gilardii subsp. gilardii]|uniref:hypothetical protein n=1 Tax=Roseomonas gilardii TaxID=257708 RepID=UPI001FF8B0E1|nr:hypothetical protein [Roseomonas gilardii]UPG71583.1 hypothetical protein MVG78_13565 [Roseomonas gilardii subsp. gilardii]